MKTVIEGIILGLSITAPIGPTNIEVIRRGLKEGWKSSSAFCMGVIIALVIYLVVVAFGLSFLTKSELFNTVLLFFGVVVLVYLAVGALRDFFRQKKLAVSGVTEDSRKHLVPGIVLTISNPAVLLLWTGIMGANLAATEGAVQKSVFLISGILVGVTLFFISLNVLIHFGRRLINGRNFRYISLGAGLILFYFACKFGCQLFEKITDIT